MNAKKAKLLRKNAIIVTANKPHSEVVKTIKQFKETYKSLKRKVNEKITES